MTQKPTKPGLLRREQVVPGPLERVFAFFASPENLEQITPPFLHFRIMTPRPVPFHPGARIRYRLRLHGVPFSWETVIEEVVQGRRFVDVQDRGPYKLWRHLHEFEEVPGGVLVRDTVEYKAPLGVLGGVARRLFVDRALAQIFDYRREAVERILGSGGASPAWGERS